jgi:restriction system protein
VIGGRGDLGVDVQAMDPQGRTVGIQCKRYSASTRVSSREMQLFFGMLVHHQLERGIYVTTSTFTDAARALARGHEIELFDREWLSRHF